MFQKRDLDLIRAATWGCWDAVKTKDHLGDAARKRGLVARTATGDAHETAFKWARQEQRAHDLLAVPQPINGTLRDYIACTCSYDESEEMTRHAPLCSITKAGINW